MSPAYKTWVLYYSLQKSANSNKGLNLQTYTCTVLWDSIVHRASRMNMTWCFGLFKGVSLPIITSYLPDFCKQKWPLFICILALVLKSHFYIFIFIFTIWVRVLMILIFTHSGPCQYNIEFPNFSIWSCFYIRVPVIMNVLQSGP